MDSVYSPIDRAWYFGSEGDICKSQTIDGATVNIDFDHYGNVLGVEVLEPSRQSKEPE